MNAASRTPSGELNLNAQNHTIRITGNNGISYLDPYHPKTVVDVKVDDETIVITYIQRAIYTYITYNNHITIGGPQSHYHNPDKVFKEIYGAKDGKLVLIKTIHGRIIPPTLEETYEFDEE